MNGYWNLRTPNQNDGTYRETFFHIEQSGEALSGELIRRPQGIPSTGTFKDGVVHFVTVPHVGKLVTQQPAQPVDRIRVEAIGDVEWRTNRLLERSSRRRVRGVALPANWHLEYLKRRVWTPVPKASGYPTDPMRTFVDVIFPKIKTQCLRAVFNASGTDDRHAAVAVEEWEALTPTAKLPSERSAPPTDASARSTR